jgi:hypothetical protein
MFIFLIFSETIQYNEDEYLWFCKTFGSDPEVGINQFSALFSSVLYFFGFKQTYILRKKTLDKTLTFGSA